MTNFLLGSIIFALGCLAALVYVYIEGMTHDKEKEER